MNAFTLLGKQANCSPKPQAGCSELNNYSVGIVKIKKKKTET